MTGAAEGVRAVRHTGHAVPLVVAAPGDGHDPDVENARRGLEAHRPLQLNGKALGGAQKEGGQRTDDDSGEALLGLHPRSGG